MKKKAIALVSAVVLGVGLTFSPIAPSTASGNVILASVEWVNSQLNPLRTRVTDLESLVQRQQNEINQLRSQIQAGGGSTAPSNPPAENVSRVFVSVSSATIHSGATRDYRVVATRSSGTALDVIATHNGSAGLWYRVNVSSTLQGWIFSGDVSTTQVSAPTQAITTATANVRRGATVDYAIVATVPAQTTLRYIGSHTNNRGELWYNIEMSNGVRGWILASLATVR